MTVHNWQCPFCGHHTTITDQRQSLGEHRISLENKLGLQVLKSHAIACPNEACKELFLTATLGPYERFPAPGRFKDGAPQTRWALRPQASVKTFPDYVPAPVLSDYREACLIRDLSPKASATLARRCLQGMIRNFWDISRPRLCDEIKALEEKVDAVSWGAIDAVRKIGNIGAHMEKDINLVIDVDPSEAKLLIELVETLIQDWYVERHERANRMNRIVAAAEAKKPTKPADERREAPILSEIETSTDVDETAQPGVSADGLGRSASPPHGARS